MSDQETDNSQRTMLKARFHPLSQRMLSLGPAWSETWKDCPLEDNPSVGKISEWLETTFVLLKASEHYFLFSPRPEDFEQEAADILAIIGQNVSTFRPAQKVNTEAYFFDHYFIMNLNKFFRDNLEKSKRLQINSISFKAMALHVKLFLDGRKFYTREVDRATS